MSLRPQDHVPENPIHPAAAGTATRPATLAPAGSDDPRVEWGFSPRRRRLLVSSALLERILSVLVVASVVVGCVLRFAPASALWLDEALSVNISRLAVPEVLDALRRDGAPPLYYLLLHGWMRLLGDGDWVVRTLSGVFGLAALPVAFHVGRRMGGRWLGWALLVLLATSPFAIRYSSEARMYSLVVLLALAAHLAVLRTIERPTAGRTAVVTLVTAALVYTHYWSFFLVAASVVALLYVGWRRKSRPALLAAAAVVAGSALILPWLPTLLYQAAHTGAPWAYEPEPLLLAEQLSVFAGGNTNAGAFLGIALVLLLALGLLGHRRSGAIQLGRPPSAIATAAAVAAGTLLLGFLSAIPTNGAYAGRYTAVALGLVLLVVARGVVVPPSRKLRLGLLATVAMLGSLAANALVETPRTQAPQIARKIVQQGQPGDVVAYCPADLGPSVHRLLPDGLQQLTFPAGDGPELVDWVDYLDRVRAADLDAFAGRLLERAGPDSRLFVVWTPAHGPLGARCSSLLKVIDSHRARTLLVGRSSKYQERALLVRYDP